MKLYQSLCVCCVVLVSLTCRDKGTEPPPPGPEPGKRNYVWTVDTLSYPGSFQTLMRDIWASSPKDVYVVGHNDQGFGKMYHFNGMRWEPVKLVTAEGGLINGPIDLSAIYGFGPNDIYAVGQRIYQNPTPPPNFLDTTLIIHYDGSAWGEVSVEKHRALFDLSGYYPKKQLTATGRGTSSIYHFMSGGQWVHDSIALNVPSDGEFQFNSVSFVSENELFASGVTHINALAQDTYYFFHYLQGQWTIIDSVVINPMHNETKWGYSKVWMSPWGKLYSIGSEVFSWNGSAWSQILNSDAWLSGIFSTSERNLFVVGQFGGVYHYNGADWYRFTKFPPTNLSFSTEWFFNGWTDGNEVFIVGQAQGRQTFILHGK